MLIHLGLFIFTSRPMSFYPTWRVLHYLCGIYTPTQ